jgi:membrane-bound metal-dependent hydrolase YbcI (DUF457 family)
MQGPVHLMASWYLAEAAEVATPRDRRVVAWAGFAPDFDVVAYLAAILWYGFDKDRAFENVWSVIHHKYTHGILFVAVIAAASFALASGARGNKARVAGLAAAAAGLHCFLDVAAGGPTWPIYPYWPLDPTGFTAAWSWTIGEWPNLVVLFACLAGVLLYGRIAGRSPLECFGDRADRWLVRTVRQEAPPGGATASSNRTRIAIWVGLAIVVAAVLYPLGFNPFR